MIDNTIFRDPLLLQELEKNSRIKHIPKDGVLMTPGEKVVFVPIVQSGILRILRQDEEGREVFLYHLYPGQTCAMAINCCQSNRESMVKAIAEDDTEVLLVPVKLVDDWYRFPEWKTFINSTYGARFAELIEVIDLIAFNNMDKQLLHYLEQRAKAANSTALFITHQQIADELHTHREAISRLLRSMEQKNLVKLGRNSIEILS